jgi:hypothetical protein
MLKNTAFFRKNGRTLSVHVQRHLLFSSAAYPVANPTIASYNASVVNFYNATGSLARFENKKYFILLWKTLWPTTTLAL